MITTNADKTNKIGHWNIDKDGLPSFEYIGSIPYTAQYSNGEKVKLAEDPWFLLGNYRLTLFTHISGIYQFISGEREWSRLNQGDKPNSGANSASLLVSGKANQLTGMNSLASDPKTCKRTFGCGYADYKYRIEGLECRRNLSVRPSTNPYNGSSAFLITITLKNTTSEVVDVVYKESVTANYVPMKQQRLKKEDWTIQYDKSISKHEEQDVVFATTKAKADDPFLLPSDPNTMSEYDGYPPSLFLKVLDKEGDVSFTANELIAEFKTTLEPNSEKSFQVIVGSTFDTDSKTINTLANQLDTSKQGVNKFAKEWMNALPSFPSEKNEVFKREMVWNAYNLEAMATYSEYYNETKIPQGTVYAYDLGIHASIRDNLQHALPLPHYNPALAKSVLKYMMKRCTPQGEVQLIEWGFGYSSSWYFVASDQQLFSFMYFAEYLRVTKDYAVLNETAAFFPYKNMPKASLLDYVEAQFKYLRDQVSTGEHGLVRLLNADWNDFVYHVVKEPYNNVLYSGESHMNSAMAISILDDLIPQLKNTKKAVPKLAARLNVLIQSMQLYRDKINTAFMDDLGDRNFPRRLYFNGKAYGEDNMFLEPQGYTLQVNSLSPKQKEELYKEMQKSVYKNEKIAARQQQTPEFESEEYEKGSRENGGVWWALNGPVILGVAKFNKQEAWRLLQNITFDNFAKQFPAYWSSYWSQADNFESSLMSGDGLPDQTDNFGDTPVFCAHAHAWPLYCYYKLKE